MSKAVAKRKAMTPEERATKRAFEIEAKVKEGVGAIRTVWVALASYLHEFHESKLWEHLDYDTFEEWLGTPEIGLSRSQVYALIEAYRELVVKRELDQEILARHEATKIAQVLPSLRRGDVELDAALADCENLSRADLRAKYGKEKAVLPASTRGLVRCEDCGCMREPHDPESTSNITRRREKNCD